MRSIFLILAFFLLCNSSIAVPAAKNNARQDESLVAPTVTIDSGVVIGVQTRVSNSPNKVNKYLGLPFAASPTRFAPPQTATPWSKPYMATQNGPACVQVRGLFNQQDLYLVTPQFCSKLLIRPMGNPRARPLTKRYLAIQLPRIQSKLHHFSI